MRLLLLSEVSIQPRTSLRKFIKLIRDKETGSGRLARAHSIDELARDADRLDGAEALALHQRLLCCKQIFFLRIFRILYH